MTKKQIIIIVCLIMFVLILFVVFTPRGNKVEENYIVVPGYTMGIDEFVDQYYKDKISSSDYRIRVGYSTDNIAIGSLTYGETQKYWYLQYLNNSWTFVSETTDYFDCSILSGLTNLPNVFQSCKQKDGSINYLYPTITPTIKHTDIPEEFFK